VNVSGEIGRRTHPATGRTIIYLACTPADDAEPAVVARREVAEVRWAGLDELDELMPDLYEPAREHLAGRLGSGAPRRDR
jgi:8-oxo-dGTP diphosphatase